jgi:hypothetical protein
MKHLLGAATIFTLLGASAAPAQDSDCGARGPEPKAGEIKLMSWNIRELATANKIYDRYLRSEDEFNELRAYRRCHDGDVYGLQEIGSLQALGRIFPPTEYILCITGQGVADERGLSPDYPRDRLTGITPECVTDAATPVSTLPTERTNPGRQYVALAVKRSADIAISDVKDIVDLGPKDPTNGHQTRWALDVTLSKGGSAIRLLVVHMKSGCTEGPIQEPSSNPNCHALSRQLPHLKNWIWNAHRRNTPVIVLGDFNRRLDRESAEVTPTDLWDIISGASTPTNTDDSRLIYIPANKEFKCWPTQPAAERFSMDFFVLNEKAKAIADTASYWKWRYGKDIEEQTPESRWPSDHCPIQLNVKLP